MRGEERQQRSMLMVMNVEQRIPGEHSTAARQAAGGSGAAGVVADLRSDVQPERPARRRGLNEQSPHSAP